MSDDRMQEQSEMLHDVVVNEAINKQRAMVPPPGAVGPEHCEVCGDDIPDGRRKLGYRICVFCSGRAHG